MTLVYKTRRDMLHIPAALHTSIFSIAASLSDHSIVSTYLYSYKSSMLHIAYCVVNNSFSFRDNFPRLTAWKNSFEQSEWHQNTIISQIFKISLFRNMPEFSWGTKTTWSYVGKYTKFVLYSGYWILDIIPAFLICSTSLANLKWPTSPGGIVGH